MPRCNCCRNSYSFFGRMRAPHYACLDCCISFKGVKVCPHCHEEMTPMGDDFKAPKKSQKNQWDKIRFMVENKLFSRWDEDDIPPSTLGEAKQLDHLVKNPSTSYKGKHKFYRW